MCLDKQKWSGAKFGGAGPNTEWTLRTLDKSEERTWTKKIDLQTRLN